MPKVVHTSTLAVNSDTEAHDVALAFAAQGLPGAWLKPPLQTTMQPGPGPAPDRGVDAGVLRAAGYRSDARRRGSRHDGAFGVNASVSRCVC